MMSMTTKELTNLSKDEVMQLTSFRLDGMPRTFAKNSEVKKVLCKIGIECLAVFSNESVYKCKGYVSFDGVHLLIYTANQKWIKLMSSEWASISSLDYIH